MRGSKLAELVEGDIIREKRLKSHYIRRKFIKEHCQKCKNKKTNLCNITQDIEGKIKCINEEKESE